MSQLFLSPLQILRRNPLRYVQVQLCLYSLHNVARQVWSLASMVTDVYLSSDPLTTCARVKLYKCSNGWFSQLLFLLWQCYGIACYQQRGKWDIRICDLALVKSLGFLQGTCQDYMEKILPSQMITRAIFWGTYISTLWLSAALRLSVILFLLILVVRCYVNRLAIYTKYANDTH